MRRFRWLGPGQLAEALDLRQFDWRLVEGGNGDAAPNDLPCLLLADRGLLSARKWIWLHGLSDELRGQVLLAGVGQSEERAWLLQLGIGDVLEPGASLAELAARAQRIVGRIAQNPLRMTVGPMTLDLAAREGFVAGRRLGLHPREFALLWRLAQSPGQPASRAELLAEVWHLARQPETNSLAVHVCRLRAKLRIAGLDGIIASTADGYVLLPGLDARERIGKVARTIEEDPPPCPASSSPTTVSA